MLSRSETLINVTVSTAAMHMALQPTNKSHKTKWVVRCLQQENPSIVCLPFPKL